MSDLISLSEFQMWMQQQLLYPNGDTAADGSFKEPFISFDQVVNDSTRLSARDHLAIYQRSYIARLRDCMCKVFGALEYALGEELFVAFADAYLESHPSSNYNLSNLGAQFADFLETTRPDAQEIEREDWPDFMIELARFEFAISSLFDQEDLSKNTLATAETPESDLRLCHVLELFEFRFPIRPFYSAFVNGNQPDLPEVQQTYCAVIRQRQNFRIALYDLQPAQYFFLKRFKENNSVQQTIDFLITKMSMDEKQLRTVWETWKQTWIDTGFLEEEN